MYSAGTGGISVSSVGPVPFPIARSKGSLKGRTGGAGIDMTGFRAMRKFRLSSSSPLGPPGSLYLNRALAGAGSCGIFASQSEVLKSGNGESRPLGRYMLSSSGRKLLRPCTGRGSVTLLKSVGAPIFRWKYRC